MPIAPKKTFTPLDKQKIASAYKQGQALQAANRLPEAVEVYRTLVRHYPTVAEAHYQIACILLSVSRLVDARASCETALKLRPREEALWLLLADISREDGKPPKGAILARARKAGLAADVVARIDGRFSLPSQQGAMPAAKGEVADIMEKAKAMSAQGDEAGALRILSKGIARHPDAAGLHVAAASSNLTLGDLDAALDHAQRACALAPDAGLPWDTWARIRKIKADDQLLAELETRFAKAAPGTDDRRQMAFALAKAMEDIRADDRLFTYLNEANELTARRFPYGYENDERAAAEARKTYTPSLVERWRGKGETSAAPIFVTGLPRSGTTLIEQIISSHPKVAAGGEMSLVNAPLTGVVTNVARSGDEGMGDQFAKVGSDYVRAVSALHPGYEHVTDKSISTYAYLGYVPLALPRAKIIVVRRDPRDSCLSLLKQRFQDGLHRYTYSMDWTAKFYKLFARQVAFWREHAPDDFIEVWYEDVIADLEGQARRMIDYVGLEWDEACINFHRNDRAVKTLSASQVRQPLYSSSVGAWKRYEADLQPLLAALGPVGDLR